MYTFQRQFATPASPAQPLVDSAPKASELRQISNAAIALSVLNDRARIAAQRIFDLMGWPAGTPIEHIVLDRVLAIRAAEPRGSRFAVDSRGHIRLPAAVQRATGTTAGDAVLLMAFPASGLVAVVPPAVLFDALSPVLAYLQVLL
ncbi:hypothetical protein ACIBCD_15340 [Nocardia brasiliensis]|uniref:hypothetical protein n=1 Tax=Nocardia brasiliensis TaxID=37326 RepID=UPI00378747E5